MIYDDQKQMVEAARVAMQTGNNPVHTVERTFAAIDREALIEKGDGKHLRLAMKNANSHAEIVEAVLLDVGIIPESKPDTYKRTVVGA